MTNTSTTPRPAPPIPVPDPSSEPFWEATRRGELVVQRCERCGHLAYPPGEVCDACSADTPEFTWAPVSGDGRLTTWTIVRDAFLPGFVDQTPYVVAEVALNDQPGLFILARLIDVDETELAAGLALTVDFVDGGEGSRIPIFRPTSQGASS